MRLTIQKGSILYGDVNGDGTIDVTDAMYIFQCLGQRRELNWPPLASALSL